MSQTPTALNGISEIRRFFRTNRTPIHFVSATPFNLLGIDRWVQGFRYISYYDCFDGHHPRVLVPREREPRAFTSIEEICNYLLSHKEVADSVRTQGPGKAVFLMFDEETEVLARELELDVAFPRAALRHRLDSKIVTTQLAAEAGVPSVPNALGRAASYAELRDVATAAGLGGDLVVQTPYGDSGQTTFFIASEVDWDRDAAKIIGEELKVMKRIDPRELAVEAVVGRHGTIVGPLLTELAGFPELTPYLGGWCGNDVAGALDDRLVERLPSYTRAIGDRLYAEGYRGYFELDFLADAGSGELYLGELNPRVTGASSMTNVTAVAYGDMPLFLFHLLEFLDVDYELEVDEVNARWAAARDADAWSQCILKQTEDVVERITCAPASGIWRLEPDGGLSFARRDTDWHGLGEHEAFYLRIAGEGDYRYPGADLGILITRGRLMDADHELTDRARALIAGIKAHFAGEPPPRAVDIAPEPFGTKLL